jgi:hypothetical protein
MRTLQPIESKSDLLDRMAVNATAGRAPNLARDYGLRIDAVRPHPGGFESDCLVVNGTWFVKIWRGGEPPARLDLLYELNAAGLPVPAPVPTRGIAGKVSTVDSAIPLTVWLMGIR